MLSHGQVASDIFNRHAYEKATSNEKLQMLRAEGRAVFPHEDFGVGGAVAAVVSAYVYLEV